LAVSDLSTPSPLPRDAAEAHRRLGETALLAVPVIARGRVRAVFELVETRTPRAFSGSDVAFAELAAGHAARLFVDHVAADEDPPSTLPLCASDDAAAGPPETERFLIAPGHRVQHEGEATACDTSRDDGAAGVLERITEWPDACTLYRIEDGLVTPYLPDDTGGSHLAGDRAWRLEDLPTVTRELMAGSPVAISAEEERHGGAKRLLDGRGLFGLVLAPVVLRDRLIGVFELGSTGPVDHAVARRIAPVVAGLLATTLGGEDTLARLRRRNRDLTLVVKAGLEDTARLSTDDILHAVAERLSEVTRTPVADIYALEGDALRALVSYDHGRFETEWGGVVTPLSRYPCSRRAIETGAIVAVASLDDPGLDDAARASLERWGYQAHLSMPLSIRGHVLGVVELSDHRPRDFTDDLDLIHGLGQVAAHALENASLFEQVERRNRILNELVDLGALASRTRDLDRLVRTAAERVVATVDAADCDVYRMQDGELVCVASFDRSGHDDSVLGARFDLDLYPTAAEAASSHQILTISSPDDPQLSEAERSTCHDYGFSSEVCLPLVVNDELFGLLDVYDTRERDYSEFMGFLRSIAQALAGAFESARLIDQLEQRSAALRDVVELGAVAAQAQGLDAARSPAAARPLQRDVLLDQLDPQAGRVGDVDARDAVDDLLPDAPGDVVQQRARSPRQVRVPVDGVGQGDIDVEVSGEPD
jgi:GAF domain-containing protein